MKAWLARNQHSIMFLERAKQVSACSSFSSHGTESGYLEISNLTRDARHCASETTKHEVENGLGDDKASNHIGMVINVE